MIKKKTLLLFCSALLIHIALSASIQNKTSDEALKKILSFINQQADQTNPVFDLSTKPNFDLVDSSIDQIIQKAIYEKDFAYSPTNNNTESTALEQKKALKLLYQKDSTLFSTPEDTNKQTKIVQITIPREEHSPVTSNEFDEEYEPLPTPTEFSEQPSQEDFYNDTSIHGSDLLVDNDLLSDDYEGSSDGLSSDNNESATELPYGNESSYDNEPLYDDEY